MLYYCQQSLFLSYYFSSFSFSNRQPTVKRGLCRPKTGNLVIAAVAAAAPEEAETGNIR